MRVAVLDHIWELVYEDEGDPLPHDLGWGDNGSCDPPSLKGKRIVIRRSLRGEQELQVTIHELLHAADYTKTEEWVDESAHDIARVLWRLGWRKG